MPYIPHPEIQKQNKTKNIQARHRFVGSTTSIFDTMSLAPCDTSSQ